MRLARGQRLSCVAVSATLMACSSSSLAPHPSSAAVAASTHAVAVLPPAPAVAVPRPILDEAYQVEVISHDATFPVASYHGVIDGLPADPRRVDDYAALFRAEFSRYPVCLVRASRLKRVVFCQDLRFAGHRRYAIPDFEHDTLYLDVGKGTEEWSYLRHVIHHEFFHIVDYNDDYSLYADEAWLALNLTPIDYGMFGTAIEASAESSVMTAELPGFLNSYSTTGIEEDKAEVFATLVLYPGYLQSRALEDHVLRWKVQSIQELLLRQCPETSRLWNRPGRDDLGATDTAGSGR